MDADDPIGRNLAALKRIVASIVAMMAGRVILPRQFCLAVLRMLRPAESAARRLIIASATGISLRLSSFAPRPVDAHQPWRAARVRRAGRRQRFLLTDPLPRITRRPRSVAPHAAPLITCPGFTRRFELPPPPRPDDRIDAGGLSRRIALLADALENLPAQAMRFARWKAMRDAAARRQAEAMRAEASCGDSCKRRGPPWRGQPLPPPRFIRTWPLRAGGPPGGRLSCHDPDRLHGGSIREIDEVLAHCHALAVYGLEEKRRIANGEWER